MKKDRQVKLIDGELAKPKGPIWTFDSDGVIRNILQFNDFIRELKRFLEYFDLPDLIVRDVYESQIFKNLYVDAVSDCPLTAKNVQKVFNHVKSIQVAQGEPWQPYVDANPEPHHFTFNWTFHYCDQAVAQTVTRCVFHVAARDGEGRVIPMDGYFGTH